MFSTLSKLLMKKNNQISRVEYALIKLNSQLYQHISLSPELVNYNFESNAVPKEQFIFCEYPFIRFELGVFRTTIQYEEVFFQLNDNYELSHIENIIIKLLCEKLSNNNDIN